MCFSREQNYETIPSSDSDSGTGDTARKNGDKEKKKTTSRKKKVGLLIGGVCLAIFGAAMFPLVDYVIRDQIKKKVIISNTSETYDIWQDNPVPIYMQFYLFNVENEKEILAGEKPAVSQHGPYTYRERRLKFNIQWNPNGTVSYLQNKTYTFVPEMSQGKESDLIKTVNPLMATVVQAIKWLPPWIRVIISTVIGASGADGLFMTRPVHEILWGYEDSTLTTLNGIIPRWFFSTNIGYFTHRNYTDDGLYTVYTGEKDINDLGSIEKYRGKPHLDLWTSPWANMVNGSDGSVGPPFQFEELVLPAFISQLCRSVNGYFEGIFESPQGIPLRRFTGNNFTFANSEDDPNNIGFCTPQSRCLPSGLINSTLCQDLVDYFRVPAILSFPHFLYADPEVQNSVYGMYPDKKEHETVIDVEPWTGMVLRVASRLQINFYVESVVDVRQTHNIRSLYFPIFWLNESAVTDKEHEDLLLNELFAPMTIMKGVKIGFLTIGLLLCGVAIFLITKQAREETKPLSSYKRVGNANERIGDSPDYSHINPLGGNQNSSRRYTEPPRSGPHNDTNNRVGNYENLPNGNRLFQNSLNRNFYYGNAPIGNSPYENTQNGTGQYGDAPSQPSDCENTTNEPDTNSLPEAGNDLDNASNTQNDNNECQNIPSKTSDENSPIEADKVGKISSKNSYDVNAQSGNTVDKNTSIETHLGEKTPGENHLDENSSSDSSLTSNTSSDDMSS